MSNQKTVSFVGRIGVGTNRGSQKSIVGSCIFLTYSVLLNKLFSEWFCSFHLWGPNDRNSILFIMELECHPKERILILFFAFSFWNSPKRMHPKMPERVPRGPSFSFVSAHCSPGTRTATNFTTKSILPWILNMENLLFLLYNRILIPVRTSFGLRWYGG